LESSIGDLRKEIDELDKQIINLLKKRTDIAKKIGELKLEKKLPTRDNAREQEVLDRVAAGASEQGLNPELAKCIFREIIKLSVEAQKEP